MKFSIVEKVFIVRVYYATESYKKVREEFSAKYSEVLLILTIILCGQVKIHIVLRVNSASWKNRSVVKYIQEKNCGANFFTSTSPEDVCQDIIRQFVPQIEKSECRSWLQQDNAHPLLSINTASFLHEFFNKRLISTNLWPPHSPDLSPLDLFLWAT